MTVPKCTKWFGHKFEARYTSDPVDVRVVEMALAAAKTSTGARDVMEGSKGERYERDICIHCGHVIERNP